MSERTEERRPPVIEEADIHLLRMMDLVRITGVPRSTIHYYLGEGLLSQPERTGKTMAYYNTRNVEELQEIRRLQDEGYPIRIIKKVMEGGRRRKQPVPTEGEAAPARKQQIIDAAVETFSRVGYQQARIGDIARAVGVGNSTFYLYFPSKKALFMECLDRVFQEMFQDVVEEIKTEKHPLKRLRLRGEVVLKSHTQFLDILQVLRGSFEDDPYLESKRKEIYSLILDHLKRDLEEAVEAGIFPPLDSEAVAYMLLGLLETAPSLMSLAGDYTVDGILDTLEQLIFYR